MKYLLFVIIISYKMAEINIQDILIQCIPDILDIIMSYKYIPYVLDEPGDDAIININLLKTLCGNNTIHVRQFYGYDQTLNSTDLTDFIKNELP